MDFKPSRLNGRSLPLIDAESRKTLFHPNWRVATFSSALLKHRKTGKVSVAEKKIPGKSFLEREL
jgi:hypothetical protein